MVRASSVEITFCHIIWILNVFFPVSMLSLLRQELFLFWPNELLYFLTFKKIFSCLSYVMNIPRLLRLLRMLKFLNLLRLVRLSLWQVIFGIHLSWYSRDIVLRLSWDCPEIVLILSWYCPEIILRNIEVSEVPISLQKIPQS